MFGAVAGGAAAAGTVARWSGRALDPAAAAVFLDAPAELLRISDPDDLWAAVADAEPEPLRVFAGDAALDEALAGFGDAADLKSPWFTGHSRGVARLARAAAERLSLADAVLLYRAGLVHDLGRVAVPAGVWERPGPLRAEDWDLVRLHPYHARARDPPRARRRAHQAHTVHIYAKCEVSTRAALAMFAMRHGLTSAAGRGGRKID